MEYHIYTIDGELVTITTDQYDADTYADNGYPVYIVNADGEHIPH